MNISAMQAAIDLNIPVTPLVSAARKPKPPGIVVTSAISWKAFALRCQHPALMSFASDEEIAAIGRGLLSRSLPKPETVAVLGEGR
jgi:hypothetical protein